MCGICGILGDGAGDEKSIGLVADMTQKLLHRGPDDSGCAHGRNYAFGHRRLSIIDIEHGHQPMFSEDGRYVVQVAVFKSRKQSNNLVEKLKSAGFPAYVASVEDPTPEMSGTWYRVRIGNFADAKSARNFGEETLRGQGYDYWLDNKSNDHKVIAASEGGSSYTEPAASSYSEPASSYSSPASSSSYSAPAETAPSTTPSEPATSSPEPVPAAASEPPPAKDEWGTPEVPAVPKDTARPVEGW